MIPEDELTSVEQGVLAAFRADGTDVDVAGAKIQGDFLRGLFLGKYDKEADYRGTCITNAIISNTLEMEFCETKFPVRFHNCSFVREIKLQQLTCPELDFRGCTLKGIFDAQLVKVSGGVDMREVNSTAVVGFDGAEIRGQLNCMGGSFRSRRENKIALTAQNIKIAGDMFLCNGFSATGEVSLLDAEIEGQLVCAGGSFQNKGGIALNAQGIKVASNVSLAPHDDGKKARQNFSANGWMSFTSATIDGNLMLHNCKLTHLSLAGTNVMGEFLDDANIYKDNKGNDTILDIDGFRYQRLGIVNEQVKNRLAWAGSMSKGNKFYPQPYEQLMKVYREMGHMNWARRVGFELEKKRHKQLRLNRDHKRFVVFGWAWWMWYWILRGTIGYGYKPFRSLYWFLPLIFAGFALFNGAFPCPDPCRAKSESCHCMAPSDAEVLLSDDWKVHGKLPKDYPDFNPVYYAVESALPVLPLGQTENWHPKTPWVRWVQGLITIIGALVLTILASYGVGVLGPRWKDG